MSLMNPACATLTLSSIVNWTIIGKVVSEISDRSSAFDTRWIGDYNVFVHVVSLGD
jgi:hypothetical protein